MLDTVRQLADAGVSLLQYRDKRPDKAVVLRAAEQVRNTLAPFRCRLILNDHADLAARIAADGVHLGQTDTSLSEARQILGPDRIIGLSTHNRAQIQYGTQSCADYLAIGPVWITSTKRDADSPVGLSGVAEARSLTSKPLVAIGGITHTNAQSVLDAGADSIAIVSALLPPGVRPGQAARDLLQLLR